MWMNCHEYASRCRYDIAQEWRIKLFFIKYFCNKNVQVEALGGGGGFGANDGVHHLWEGGGGNVTLLIVQLSSDKGIPDLFKGGLLCI